LAVGEKPLSTGPRTLLVTGASRGIGRAVCEKLLGEGCRVIGIARHPPKAGIAQHNLVLEAMDLSRLDRLPDALRALGKRFPAIDGIICNAGQGRFGSLEEFSPRQVRALIDLNLTSQILLAREFLPALKARGRGDIIFMGSESALAGGRKGAVYSATKFGLRGLTQSLREECTGSGVRVGIVNPGMVQSDFFKDLDFRPGDQPDAHLLPGDVAEAVWLMPSARPGAAVDEINLSPQKKVIQFRKPS
jgi:NAD(P)-dependent dehydrogenase (short-subunit alcohol dehydrogenase family)